MAMTASWLILPFPLVLLLAGTAGAQSLGQPRSLDQPFDVVQFGVSRDARFVFCDGEDCPQRSIKHLQLAPAPPPRLEEPELPAPEPLKPSEELSRAKVEPQHKPPRKKRSKPKVQYECKPVTRGR